jgi:hypothetical protein
LSRVFSLLVNANHFYKRIDCKRLPLLNTLKGDIVMPQTRVDIIPAQEGKLILWGNQMLSHLTPEMGVAQEEIDGLRAQIAEFGELVWKSAETQTAAKQATARKNTARRALDTRLRSTIRRLKVQADYSISTGLRLGVEAQAKVMSGEPPVLSARDKTGGVVEIRFSKGGSDGVNIYTQREGDSDWVMLCHAPASPFVDQRPLLVAGCSELRRYSAVYVKRRSEVGGFSGDVVLACAP